MTKALLEAALYALEYASDITKPEDLSGCGCPICTTIPLLITELAKPKPKPYCWEVEIDADNRYFVYDPDDDLVWNDRENHDAVVTPLYKMDAYE